MNTLTRMLLLSCGVTLPVPLVAQGTAPHGTVNLMQAGATRPMRPSMVIRYATRPPLITDSVAVREQLEQLAKHLTPSALSFLGTMAHSNPSPMIDAGRMRHER